MLALVDQIRYSTQLRWNRVHKFKTKIPMLLECGPYLIKTAESSKELIESFKLRDEVFNREFRGQDIHGLDFDRFDYHFDHLIIVHKSTQRIIGTYRLNCSTFSDQSYTALEFEMRFLESGKGPFLELGRACIQKEFRKGSVMSLLWRGIAEYMNLCKAEILFGCSSLKVDNAREAALVYRHLLNQGFVTHEYLCRPTHKYSMKEFDMWFGYFRSGLTENQMAEAENLIPSLLRSYLKLGAKIASEPAFDQEFDCIDLLTVLRKENLSFGLAERFRVIK